MIHEETKRLNAERVNGVLLADLIRRPGFSYRELVYNKKLPNEVIEQIEINAAYHGYIEREREHILSVKKSEEDEIPGWIDYHSIQALRYEARVKLDKIKPITLAQASRIPGVNPADIFILSIVLKRQGADRKR